MALTSTDFDNAEIDLQTTSIVANSKTLAGAATDTTTTRLGDTTDTLNGRLRKLGYIPPIAYAGGIAFTALDNVKTVEESGSRYAPKVGDLPFTTSGTWVGDDEDKFYLIEGARVPQLSAEFADISNLVGATSLNAGTVDWADYEGRDVHVVVNNTTSKAGAADYTIKTVAQAATDGDVIDGTGAPNYLGANHALTGGTHVAILQNRGGVSIESCGGGKGIADSGPAIRAALVLSLGDTLSGIGDVFVRSALKVYTEQPKSVLVVDSTVVIPSVAHIDFNGAIVVPGATIGSTAMFTGDGWKSLIENATICENSGVTTEYSSVGFDLDSSNKDQGTTIFRNIQFKGLETAARYHLQSSTVIFDKCNWDNVRYFIDQEACDSCVILGGWGTQGALDVAGSGSFKIQAGALRITAGGVFVPKPATADETAWIDYSGSHLVVDGGSRFGGESGSKTLVNWKTEYSTSLPLSPRSCVIENNWVDMVDGGVGGAGISPSCLIRLFKVPNHIRVVGNRGFVDTRHVVAWARSISTAAEQADLTNIINTELYADTTSINSNMEGRCYFNNFIENNAWNGLLNIIEYPTLYKNFFIGKAIHPYRKPEKLQFGGADNNAVIASRIIDSATVEIDIPVPTTSNAYKVTVYLNTARLSNGSYRASRSATLTKYIGNNGALAGTYVVSMDGSTTVPFGTFPTIPDIDVKFRDSAGTITSTFDPLLIYTITFVVSNMTHTSTGWESTVGIECEPI